MQYTIIRRKRYTGRGRKEDKTLHRILHFPKPEYDVLSGLSGTFQSSGNSAATGEIKIGILSRRLWHEKRIVFRLYSGIGVLYSR